MRYKTAATAFGLIGTFLVSVTGSALLMVGCSRDESGAARERRATQIAAEEAAVTVGMPAIKNFAEKRLLKTIYELRDNASLVTYSYVIDMAGKRHKICPTTSVGYPIPYATQYTAPTSLVLSKAAYPDGTQSADWHSRELAQAEPNALHMPTSSDGTWVVCVDPKTKELSPVYVEPKVVAYLFEMPSVD